MPDDRRILRLQQLILEAAAEAVQRDVHDPRVRLVTVTRVRLAADLSTATVHWSTLGTLSERRTVERGLQDALPVIQRAIGKAMTTRITPKLSLRFDPTPERTQRLEDIFSKLRTERGEPEPLPAGAKAEGAVPLADADALEDAGDEPEEAGEEE
jgi:ribosome-binding factor A